MHYGWMHGVVYCRVRSQLCVIIHDHRVTYAQWTCPAVAGQQPPWRRWPPPWCLLRGVRGLIRAPPRHRNRNNDTWWELGAAAVATASTRVRASYTEVLCRLRAADDARSTLEHQRCTVMSSILQPEGWTGAWGGGQGEAGVEVVRLGWRW